MAVQPDGCIYKLDRGVDHVLIDEARTPARAMDIVAHIISEFTSARRATASPAPCSRRTRSSRSSRFSAAAQSTPPPALKKKFEDAGLKFDPLTFTYSFRSGAILQSVDHVFRDPRSTADPFVRALSVHNWLRFRLLHPESITPPILQPIWTIAALHEWMLR